MGNKKLTKAERDAFALVGAIGGRATAKRHGKRHMADIGRAGAKARWAKKDKS